MSPPTASSLQQQLINLDDKHDKAHERLRKDFDILTIEADNIRAALATTTYELKTLQVRTTNISTLSFSPGQLIAIVLAALTMAGGFYSLTLKQSETAAHQAETTLAVDRLRQGQETQGKAQDAMRQQIESLTNTVLIQGQRKP